MIQAGDIQAVVGDASRNSQRGQQYCGLWSLTSRHRPFNAFGNSYAGLLPGEIRGKSPTLHVINDQQCALERKADDTCPVDVRADYHIKAPNTIDHTLTFQDHRDVRAADCDHREVSWCCYMNCPDDSRLHFRADNDWHRYISAKHGSGSNIAPSYVSADQLEAWPNKSEWTQTHGPNWPFHWDRYDVRFDQPFYYGRLGEMIMILVFDTPCWLRFFCSPSGGGPSLIADRTCPAWDFLWAIPNADYQINREYTLRLRLIYKPFVSDDDVLDELHRTQTELGFETVTN
ncbi:MAG: hypothetical protein CMJ49_07180 [Planctomycetaceae bacterium]|nr:hypothetical protein [Planctomycetaceae bacterium]